MTRLATTAGSVWLRFQTGHQQPIDDLDRPIGQSYFHGVRPGGAIASISGCSTGREHPSARKMSNARKGRALCIRRNCSIAMPAFYRRLNPRVNQKRSAIGFRPSADNRQRTNHRGTASVANLPPARERRQKSRLSLRGRAFLGPGEALQFETVSPIGPLSRSERRLSRSQRSAK